MKTLSVWAAAALALASLAGCGIADYVSAMMELDDRAKTELAQLRSELEPYPDASIIVHALRPPVSSAGDTAYRQYKVVWRDPEAAADSLRVRVRFTDWAPISRNRFEKEEPLQGMAIWTRRGGEVDTVPTPPVYAYVGDERFGSWNGDEWVVAAQYMLLAEALDEVGDLAERRHRSLSRGRTVVLPRGAYDEYRADPAGYRGSYRARYAAEAAARPATAGSFDAKVRARANREAAAGKPSFVERAKARQAESTRRFDDKVKARMNGGSASSTPASAGAASSRRSTASSSSRPAASAGSYKSRPKASSGSYSSGSSSSSRRSSGSRRRRN